MYAGRILKQLEKAFIDLNCMDTLSISYDLFVDILNYLGFSGDDLSQKERIQKDAWNHLGGSDSRNISKRTLIIFINSLNNVYLQWMSELPNQETEEE